MGSFIVLQWWHVTAEHRAVGYNEILMFTERETKGREEGGRERERERKEGRDGTEEERKRCRRIMIREDMDYQAVLEVLT